MPPLVLIALPLFDQAPFVGGAIESMLAQSFGDFTLLVINDGSKDHGPDIARSYSDQRIVVVDQNNLGPGAAMNLAVERAGELGTRYVARMDADDLAMRERLALQVELLEQHSELAACSANCYYIDPKTETIVGRSTVPVTAKLVRWEIQHGLRGLVQGACLFRRDVLEKVGGYRPQFELAEDTDLFLRMSESSRMANRPEFLYKIRLRPDSLSVRDAHRSVLFHLYALDCYQRRRRGQAERPASEYFENTDLGTKVQLWRQTTVLRLWRSSLQHQSLSLRILAALLDPRRALASLWRRVL